MNFISAMCFSKKQSFHVIREHVRHVLLAGDPLHLQLSSSYYVLQQEFWRVYVERLSDVTPTSTAKLLIPMATAAPLFMAYSFASHDDNATNLGVENSV